MSIALEGAASEFAVTDADRQAAQAALDAIANAPTSSLYGSAIATLESIVNRDAPQDSAFDGGDPEDNLLKSMSDARRLRSAVAKRDDVDHDLRGRVEKSARELEVEYLKANSGFWANDELVEQAERLVKQEGGLGSLSA